MTRIGGSDAPSFWEIAPDRARRGSVTFAVPAQPTPPDLILSNGKVSTSSAGHPRVEALAIRGERIVATGTTKEIAALAGGQTRLIDLHGRTVIPGINDAHDHIQVGPDAYELPLIGDNPNWQQVTQVVAAAVARVPKGTWIVGAFGDAVLDDPQAARTVLDTLAPDDPLEHRRNPERDSTARIGRKEAMISR